MVLILIFLPSVKVYALVLLVLNMLYHRDGVVFSEV